MTPKQTTVFEGLVLIFLLIGFLGWFLVRAFSVQETVSSATLPTIPLADIDPTVADSPINKIAAGFNNESNFYGVPVPYPTETGKEKLFE